MDRHTYTALQWGTAVVGILAGAAISRWGKSDAIVELVFLVGIPALVSVGMLYWVGEIARMRRLYDFICVIEAKAELALQHEDPAATDRQWVASFSQIWTAKRDELLEGLELAQPRGDYGPVEIRSGPISWERWLRDIRNAEASGNLSWVFMVRFIVFPATIAASWAAGVFYVLHQSVDQAFEWKSLTAALFGLLLSTGTVWLAVELVIDLNRSSSIRPPELSGPRRAFRRALGSLLRITEWRHRAGG
jgi:hypothetical protein